MDVLNYLLRDAKFWTALLVLLHAIVFYFVPQFPVEIWAAVDAFTAAVLAVLSARSATAGVQAQRAVRRAASRQ